MCIRDRKIDNEKFSKEEFIHNLIFPMKCSSDDIDYESHNLWLIDERSVSYTHLDVYKRQSQAISVIQPVDVTINYKQTY